MTRHCCHLIRIVTTTRMLSGREYPFIRALVASTGWVSTACDLRPCKRTIREPPKAVMLLLDLVFKSFQGRRGIDSLASPARYCWSALERRGEGLVRPLACFVIYT
jgi:hypothetical protein